ALRAATFRTGPDSPPRASRDGLTMACPNDRSKYTAPPRRTSVAPTACVRSSGVAQARGDPGDADQQRLLHRWPLLAAGLARAGQKLGLQQVQRIQVGVAHADEFQGLGTALEYA